MATSCTVLQMTESFPICSSLEKSEVGNGYSSASAESTRLVDQSHAHFSRKELKTRVRGFGKGRPLDMGPSKEATVIWESKKFSDFGQPHPECSKAESATGIIKCTESVSSHSYAAAVIGRKSLDSSIIWENDQPASFSSSGVSIGSSFQSVEETSIISSVTNKKSTRDIGIQVGPVPRSFGTMTSSKGSAKSKAVMVKLCCNEDNSENANGIPPVEFIGKQFTFATTLSEHIAKMGIEFVSKESWSVQQAPGQTIHLY